jgi:hypothetical protein
MMQTKVLSRSENYQTRYQHWKNEKLTQIIDDIKNCYSDVLITENSDELSITKTDSQIVLILKIEDYSIDDFSFLQHYLKATIHENQYYIYMSDERIKTSNDGLIQNIHRYYLKPDVDYLDSILPNAHLLYGNITIEHFFNSNINQLVLTVNYYSQRQYNSFEKLMELLLTQAIAKP